MLCGARGGNALHIFRGNATPGQLQVVMGLEIHPKLGAIAKIQS
jgi:hypothetical protein